MIKGDRLERIARAIHEHYVRERSRDGGATGVPSAMTSWENLDEDKRDANRDQARDIQAKLRKIGCRVAAPTASTVPVGSAGFAFAFTEQELDILARDEQRRWARQRRAAGWVYGEKRNDQAKVHPCLVTWDELPEVERDKDRDAVRNIPAVLAAAGLQIVRERGAEMLAP